MTTHGKPYEANYTADNGKTIRTTRRAVYRTIGEPTIEQKAAIEKVEEIIHKDKINGDPYRVMRHAEYLGVEISEEWLVDGKWMFGPNPDVALTNMTAGAL